MENPWSCLQGTWIMHPGGTTVCVPLTLTVASTESAGCNRMTNASILYTSLRLKELWNNSVNSLSSVVCAICLMALNPRIGLLIWSVVIKNGTSRWHFSSPSLIQRFISPCYGNMGNMLRNMDTATVSQKSNFSNKRFIHHSMRN